ncbi:MAG: hypothetical protein HY682_00170 [Chloroflexi bacterium]|nr:hypothetical protein [Chloroflexota bacterium]
MPDAVSIEYAFAYLLGLRLGDRGYVNDADVFRNGRPTALAEVLDGAADAIERRTAALGLTMKDMTGGTPEARIRVGVSVLRDAAVELKKRSGDEGETYQWHVIGGLVGILAALLEHCERGQR